jgi:hypothetical protein
MTFDQAEFDIRCEWGLQGVMTLAPISDVVIIVDVFSFTTCVEIATNQGALIYPYRGDDAAGRTGGEMGRDGLLALAPFARVTAAGATAGAAFPQRLDLEHEHRPDANHCGLFA